MTKSLKSLMGLFIVIIIFLSFEVEKEKEGKREREKKKTHFSAPGQKPCCSVLG